MLEQKRIAGIYPCDLKDLAADNKRENQKLAAGLKKRPPGALDKVIHHAHEKLFERVDCLDCANCCKTTPALLEQRDIDRISRHLGMKAGRFMTEYVVMDEDGDFVLNATPCPFLGTDNYCGIYDVRPGSCADYPHTARDKQFEILDLSVENTEVCPVVFRIFEELASRYRSTGR